MAPSLRSQTLLASGLAMAAGLWMALGPAANPAPWPGWLAVSLWFGAAVPGPRPWPWRLAWAGWLLGAAGAKAGSGLWAAGCLALAALGGAGQGLAAVYRGEAGRPWLLWTGLSLGLLATVAPVPGVFLALGLALFGGVHQFLHEREEKHLLSSQVGARAVWRRWLLSWGVWCLLPGWLLWLRLAMLMPPMLVPRWSGYFGGFQAEWLAAWTPPRWQSLPLALSLAGIGLLPLVGLLGWGRRLPDRFVYRLLQQADERRLLTWLAGLALVLATCWDGRSLALLILGTPAFLLAVEWLQTQWIKSTR